MLGHNQYQDMVENRGRSRESRMQPFTPQGLGAAPHMPQPSQNMSTSPQDLGVVPAPPMNCNWRHDIPPTWPYQQQQQQDFCVGLSGGMGNVIMTPVVQPGPVLPSHSALITEQEGSRIRSISSEPRASQSGRGDRRARCSSATRNRQSRSRPNPSDHSPTISSPHLSPNKNVPPPPNSPPIITTSSTMSPHQTKSFPLVIPAVANTGAGLSGVITRVSGTYDSNDNHREPPVVPSTDLGGPNGNYGYQVSDLEALLTQASPTRPANLPMVLASATRLHNMKRTTDTRNQNSPPVRPFLPLGIIVNAVFKTRDWLYVRTAHGAEGYVPYRVCLPLGILPPQRSLQTNHYYSGQPVSVAATSTTSTQGNVLSFADHQSLNSNNNSGHNLWENQGELFASPGHLSPPKSPRPSCSSPEGNHPRGRNRGRRRPTANCNQTDLQKLQPDGLRSLSESRRLRETLDPPPSSNHLLV